MGRYRKKPVTIEAWQVPPPRSRRSRPEWLVDALNAGNVYCQGGSAPYYTIETLEGKMRADAGDWIIQGVAGELYPCKPEIFAATYEPVEAGGDDGS